MGIHFGAKAPVCWGGGGGGGEEGDRYRSK